MRGSHGSNIALSAAPDWMVEAMGRCLDFGCGTGLAPRHSNFQGIVLSSLRIFCPEGLLSFELIEHCSHVTGLEPRW